MSDSVIPGTAECQFSLSFTVSRNLLKLLCIESLMPYNHLILYHSLFLLPSNLPSIRVFFPNEWALHIRWPKYWSFSISPSNKYSELISFRTDWLDLLSVQGTLPITIWSACILHFSFSIVQKIYWAPTTMYQTLFWNLGEQWKKPAKIPVPMQPKELKH